MLQPVIISMASGPTLTGPCAFNFESSRVGHNTPGRVSWCSWWPWLAWAVWLPSIREVTAGAPSVQPVPLWVEEPVGAGWVSAAFVPFVYWLCSHRPHLPWEISTERHRGGAWQECSPTGLVWEIKPKPRSLDSQSLSFPWYCLLTATRCKIPSKVWMHMWHTFYGCKIDFKIL